MNDTIKVGDKVRATNEGQVIAGEVSYSEDGVLNIRIAAHSVATGIDEAIWDVTVTNDWRDLPDEAGVWRDAEGDDWAAVEVDGELQFFELVGSSDNPAGYAPFVKVSS